MFNPIGFVFFPNPCRFHSHFLAMTVAELSTILKCDKSSYQMYITLELELKEVVEANVVKLVSWQCL